MTPEQEARLRERHQSLMALSGFEVQLLLAELDVARAENARLREALENLLADTQHADHGCRDADCPVSLARAALKGT